MNYRVACTRLKSQTKNRKDNAIHLLHHPILFPFSSPAENHKSRDDKSDEENLISSLVFPRLPLDPPLENVDLQLRVISASSFKGLDFPEKLVDSEDVDAHSLLLDREKTRVSVEKSSVIILRTLKRDFLYRLCFESNINGTTYIVCVRLKGVNSSLHSFIHSFRWTKRS